MGNLLTHWWWGGDPDAPDSISELSRRDIYQIQRSWAPVYADAGSYGLELFRRFFRADPETKTYFKVIKDMREEQFSKNYQFQAHAINLMSSLNMAITNLHHPEVVIAMMHRLGESHQMHNVPEKYFDVLKNVMVEFLINDRKLSSKVIDSWEKFVSFIYLHIFAKLH